ncbi:MAG: hypothetical protein IJ955_03220, partial [Oscillospiraceae bacterium]|nr:hypothetical protein [Oscillospiraceae bacterium]
LGASNSGYGATKTTVPKLQVKLSALQTTTQNLGTIGTTKQATGKAADSGYTQQKKQASQAANRQTVLNYANTLAKETKLNFGSGTNRAKTQYNPALESKLGQGKNWSEPQSPVGNLFETWAANDIASKMNAVGTVLRDDGKRQGLAVDSGDVTADSENLWYNRAGRYLQNEADRAQKIAETAYTRGTAGLNNTQRMLFDAGLAGLQMAGDLGVNAATAGIISPSASMATRGFGNASMQARNAGGTHDQQLLYGGLGAAKEWGTNKIFDGIGGIYGKGATDDVVADIAKKLFKSDIGRAGFRAAAGMGMESAENVLDNVLSPALQTIYNGRTIGDVTGIRLGGLNNSFEDQRKLALQSKMGLGENWEIHNPVTKERASELLYDAAIGGLLSGIIGGRDVAQTISGNPKGVSNYSETEIEAIRYEGRTFKNLVVGVDSSVSAFFEKWRNGRKSHLGEKYEKLYLGKMPDSIKGNVSAILGYDVSERDFVLANDDAKHILDHHGDPEKELAQGNIPLEGWMLDSLPDVVTAPSTVEKGHTGSGKNSGKTGVLFKKVFPGGTVICVQFDNRGRKTMEVTTVYAKKSTTSEVITDFSTNTHTPEASEPVLSDIVSDFEQRVNVNNAESGSTLAAERQALRGEVSPLSIDRIAQKKGEIKGIYTPYRDAYHANRYQELERKYLDGSISPEEADELWELERIRGQFTASSNVCLVADF